MSVLHNVYNCVVLSGGIHWVASRQRYKVRVRVNGKRYHVAYTESLEAARWALAQTILTGELPLREERPSRPARKKKLCACGCGGSTFGTWVLGHQFGYSREEYTPDPVTGCWVWNLGVNTHGYGRFKRKGAEDEKAHRAYWIRYRGPIEKGWHVHHDCGNKLCVNPDHLRCLTPAAHTELHLEELRRAA